MAIDPAIIQWIAVDWGTSNLRIWAMSASNEVVTRRDSSKGMASLRPEEFEPALLELIDDLLPANRKTPIIACGMVGAKQGWCEAKYSQAPCHPMASQNAVCAEVIDRRLLVWLIPGISQEKPADVMRGEENQIAGLLAQDPGFEGIVCLPGTHTKWVHVSAGEVANFKTFMSGELFAVLSQHSVLRHNTDGNEWDNFAFDNAVEEAIANPESFATSLFEIRAQSILAELPPESARARLSGLILGLELAGCRSYWAGRHVTIIGAEELSHLYGRALLQQGIASSKFDVEPLTIDGLTAAYRKLVG